MLPHWPEAPFISPLEIHTSAVALVIALLGIIALIRDRGSRVSAAFFVLALCMAEWLFAFSRMYGAIDERQAIQWAKIGYIGISCLPAAVYHFCSLVLQDRERRRKPVLIIWALSALFIILSTTTDLVISSLYYYRWGIYPRLGPAGIPFLLYFFGVMVLALHRYVGRHRAIAEGAPRKDSAQLRRSRILLIAFGIGYLAAFDFVAGFGIPWYPFGYCPIFLFAMIGGYSILRYRFTPISRAFAAGQILDTMNEALLVLDQDNIVVLVNHATCSLFNCRERDLVGKRLSSSMDGNRSFAEVLESAIRSGPVRNVEVEYHASEDRTFMLSLSVSIMRNPLGEPLATVCLLNDITSCKRSEESLLLFRNLLNETNDAIFVNDPATGRFLMVNNKACSNLGYTGTELLSLRTIDIETNYPDQRSWNAHVDEVRTRGSLTVDGVHKRNDGTPLPVEVNVTYMTSGDKDYMVALARDITERKLSERALRTSEERLSKAQRMAHVGNWEWDLVTNQLWWSEEVYRIYGVDPARFAPTFEAVGNAMHPDDLQPFLAAVNAAIYERKPFELDYRLIRPDNSVRTVHTIGEVTYDASGKPVSKSGTVQDVSEAKRAEEEREQLIAKLREANEKLKSIDNMKTNFISMVSHELRTPLTTIKAFVELLIMKQRMPEEQKFQLMTTINVEADRLSRLITDLLNLARIEAGSMKWQIEEISIEELIQNVIASLELLFENKQLHVTTAFGSPLPCLSGDRDRLVQVVTNILSNAAKFTPAGGTIHVAVHHDQGPPEQIAVAVSDTGMGIPARELELIFDKFRRSDDKAVSAIEGTGLGLAISRQIVEHHCGMIWADSTHGKGSTFTFTLPVRGPA